MTHLKEPAPPARPEEGPEPEQPLLSGLQMTVACVVGVAAAAAGLFAVFKTENEVGSAALIAVGVYFLLAVIIRRFPKLKIGDNEIDPTARQIARQAARRASEAAEDAADAKEALQAATSGPPHPGCADSPAQSVDAEIAVLAAEYNAVRWTMPSSSPSRTHKMTDIVERMVARFHEVGPPPDVEALLTSKDRGLRLAGVAAVYALPRVDAVAAILDAGVTPDKPFNEYWALRALGKVLEGHCEALTNEARSRLVRRLHDIPHEADRANEIRKILHSCP